MENPIDPEEGDSCISDTGVVVLAVWNVDQSNFYFRVFEVFPATLVANVWKSREMLYGGYSKVFPIIVGRFC